VFAIDNPRSLENVIAKWEREVTLAIDQGQAPIAKIILVGTKSDTRNEKGVETIPKSSIEAVVEQIGAIKYFEVSSLQNSGIQELFDYIIEHVRVSKTFARKMGLFESGSSDLDDDVTFGNAKKK
jgi:GTPase SAR1 family protein